MNQRKLFFRAIVAVVVLGALYRVFTSQSANLVHIQGLTMGTITYNVKYLDEGVEVSKAEIDSILTAFNDALSTYIPSSEISGFNQTGTLANPSSLFLRVFEKSLEVNLKTEGAFDPTVGPLVNAWGFGPDKIRMIPDSTDVDSLLQMVGLNKIEMGTSLQMNPSMYLDFSAIAKGYAVDLLAEYLEKAGKRNYMVEIGGEVRTNGTNDQKEIWKIGIDDPTVAREEQKLLAILKLKDRAMATSGNYRNYYEKNGRIIAHTIDPRTGRNTNHNLLSASVIAADCMTADAYATAFMVLGLEASKEIVEIENLDAFLIFQDESGSLQSYVSDGIKSFVHLNKIDE